MSKSNSKPSGNAPTISEKIAAQKKAAEKAAQGEPEKNRPVVLLAWATPGVNPRLLVAYAPDTEPSDPRNLVEVLVSNNRNFMKGQKLPARKVSEGRYDLVGPVPAYRGQKLC